MASIQCAIELYDGVSPVLSNMTVALDALCQKFAYVENSAGLSFDGDISGIAAATEQIHGFAGALASAQAGQNAFNVALLAGCGYADAFAASSSLIGAAFTATASQITSAFDNLGVYIQSFASSIPGHFRGPLNTAAALFSSMAASARSSLASISSAASSVISSVRSTVSYVSSAASTMSSSLASASSAASALRASALVSPAALSLLYADTVSDDSGADSIAPISAQALSLSASTSGGDTAGGTLVGSGYEFLAPDGDEVKNTAQAVFNVQISNENHISSEVDADAVLKEFEYRFAEAVQSCAEGVLL